MQHLQGCARFVDGGVHDRERLGDGSTEMGDGDGGQRVCTAAELAEVAQRTAVDVFEHEHGVAAVDEEIQGLNDVAVAHAQAGLGLVTQARRHQRRRFEGNLQHDLSAIAPARKQRARHPAVGEAAEHGVFADLCGRRRRHVPP